MSDLNPQSDSNETPEDVATLYSWANLHGAKYRDFSAARAQTREKARLRAEQAIEEHRQGQVDDATAAAALSAAPEHQNIEAESTHSASETGQIEAHGGTVESEIAQPEAAATLESAELPAGVEAGEHARQSAQEAADLAAELTAERDAAVFAEKNAVASAEREKVAEASHVVFRAEAEQADLHAAGLAVQQAAELAARQEAKQIRAQEEAARKAGRVRDLAAKESAAEATNFDEQQARRQAEERATEEAAQERETPDPQPVQFANLSEASFTESTSTATSNPLPPTSEFAGSPRTHAQKQAQYVPYFSAAREESSMSPNHPWSSTEAQEAAVRPAWLNADRSETSNPPAAPVAPAPAADETLQGSRDRLTSRWFALRGIFDATPPPPEAAPAPVIARAPVMAIFSLAGGVGKTSMVATLGRALSSRGERVLLVDTAAFGLLPFFFGATDQRPGLLRTFNPPGVSSDAPIQMVTLDPDGMGSEPNQESLSGEIQKFSRGASRVIVDLATASGSTTRRIMRMTPLVLVPVIPDMNSVVSVSSIDAFFEHNSNPAGKPSLPFYVLNQFDGSLPLHLDVREVLREQLGERLLPFALRRTPALSEALAEGMTVMDYAPGSPLAEDFAALAGWVKSLSAPATTSYRGIRWSEK